MKDTIVLHHSAISGDNPQYDAVWRYHDSGAGGKWPAGYGIQYHHFIGKDGTEKQGHSEDYVCWNSGNWAVNQRSIAICLAGDFTNETPTSQQISTLARLITDIQHRWGIPDERVFLHHEILPPHTECPGTDLRALAFAYRLENMRDRLPTLKRAIERSKGLRKAVLTRLYNRIQTFTSSTRHD